MPHQVLAIFAKRPTPGQAKTRLAAATSPEVAAAWADAFLRDIIDKVRTLDVERVVAFAPENAATYFQELAGNAFSCVPQGDGDLGARLQRFLEARVSHDSRVVIIGSDSPTLPVDYLAKAFQLLETSDVVLGPATDGGYYLLGCTGQTPPLFTGLTWGGADVLAETVTKIEQAKLRLGLLPPWYDVDTLDDLRFLRGHLLAVRQAELDADEPGPRSCPNTAERFNRLERPGQV